MRKFKTESKKLLDLMINSIYTNREIFLRELVSNASDALDKLEFLALTNPGVLGDSDELAITISIDPEARSITVSDNGIGMDKDELDRNLGTIAHSGSELFKEENAEHQGSDIDIIGQFGVGFYSSFMVASRVRVVSRALDADTAYVWESDGLEGYSIEPAAEGGRETHGTDVTLYLRPSTEEDNTDRFLTEWGIRELVRRYSNYVRHPIRMMVTKSRELPKPEDAPEDYRPAYEQYQELETLNSMTPIWKKRASDVEQNDYDEFYKASFHDWEAPARTVSFHAEGGLSYDALLFVPSHAPFDLYSQDYEKGLALYSSNVLIQDKCADLLPDYYNFVRGVVDSPDVHLNISRETLQQNAQLRAIARRVERKIHDDLVSFLADDREGYEKFFVDFGRALKFGIFYSYGEKAADLAPLLLFWSAREKRMVTLAEYVEGMTEDQERIYFATGDSRERLTKLPTVTSALAAGVDVLLCTQDIDEFMFQMMHSFHADEDRDVELANVMTADVDFAGSEAREEAEQATRDNESLFDALAEALGDKVVAVRASSRLTDAPACISTEGDVSLEMERILSQGPEAEWAPKAQRVLELNAKHPVFAKLQAAQAAGDSDKLALYASLLYDQALLVEGLPVDDAVEFAKNICSLM